MKRAALGALIAVAALPVAFMAGLRVNTTHSLPVGFYRVVQEPVAPGAVVLACPPVSAATSAAQQRGYLGASWDCPGNYQRVIKRVAGLQGATVENGALGLRVNGQLLPNSKAVAADSRGRALLPFFEAPVTLAPGQVLIVGDTANSFDSRYFGPIEHSQIRAVLRPVWTW
ncbi:conjugative transfer signal peptidase TraF [Metapseudomonas furukawaii]|mgnify:CR=1 FL=1|uniref:conjugative transfer signal peptidase TraF n=1 Tax=Metapseudomonas furukawaii TaxID=1149133 RepID=UPI000563DE89|nr:conjugative transfer signal peptidase TraF [Pseudomonas furukawaii]